ncbi:DUF445 domain-containing protein [Corynebacterium lowii]|uniref:DUF445 domain-containing protein n=1 Tax=Corynebacterium lowii TaxID=1544413 RepID=A0A0Q0YK97_9CORY|nr:DUF445 family protein [Corynebacterium lowii]KQB87276.1 hypothetical protein Clow_00331 [Corynebacterium lowii]MDP9852136.1 uncharacterized membrane-anchored protein YjiN (DUF445 family) [Corynebacterium lowii]
MAEHVRATRPLPGPSPEAEAERRRTLRRHKAFVTGLLAVAALIFLGCTWWQHQPGGAPAWVGYVRAASEAGMVGGLADWFAVTALFRHPMGLPIPHTALIPKKKDQLGDSLSGFVGENFLNAELITEKIATANLPLHAGKWLADPAHAQRVSAEAGQLAYNALAAVKDEDAEALIRRLLIDKAAEPQWGPPAGRALEQLIDDGKTEPLIEELITWTHRKVQGSQDLITRLLDERKPVWAPRFVNDLVGEKIYRELVNWTADVAADPHHEARRALHRFLRQFAQDLQHDPQMIERVEGWKEEIMRSRPVEQAAPALWRATSRSLSQAVSDPDSLLRRTITHYSLHWGQRLLAEEKLREELNRKVVTAAAFVANNYSGQITAIISDTVRAWDAEEASEKIELMVGKDLQFIRLNGTIVGALAGLAIYTVAQVLF